MVIALACALAAVALGGSSARAWATGTNCYPNACTAGKSGTFDKNQRNMCKMLAQTSKYCVIPTSDDDCPRELKYHGWCDANRYVFNSGCLSKYPTTSVPGGSEVDFSSYNTAYWSVGAPYPLHPNMVNANLRTCVIDYVKTQLRAQFTAEGMTADEASITSLALQEFPDEQMEGGGDYNDQFSSFYLSDSDFNDLDSSDVPLSDVDGEAVESTVTKSVSAQPCSRSGSDRQCFDVCTRDLGLKSEYKIKIPKVCAKIRILGRKFKKCIKVPSTKFKVPNKCQKMCITIPRYCEMSTALTAVDDLKKVDSLNSLVAPCKAVGVPSNVCDAVGEADDAINAIAQLKNVKSLNDVADMCSSLMPSSVCTEIRDSVDAISQITQLKNVKSLNDVANLCSAVMPSSVCTEIRDSITAVSSIATMAAQTTVDGVLQVGLLPDILNGYIRDAQDALEKVADTLESSLRGLLEHVWGEVSTTSSELVSLIESSIKNTMATSSSGMSALGAARENRRTELLDDIHEGVNAAFRGLAAPARSAQSLAANLGAATGQGCFVIPVMCTEEIEYPMKWPKALENVSASPGAITVDPPDIQFDLCAQINEFKVSSQVATNLVKALGDMFEAFFDALYDESGLKDVVADIKKLGSGKFFASSSRRRLLSTDEQMTILAAHADYKNRLASAESIVLRELVKLSETIHSPDFATRSRTRAGGSREASLGKNAFDEVLDDFLDDLEAAIKLMSDTTSVKAELSIKASGSASVSAHMALAKDGEFWSDQFSGVKVVPLPLPGLSAVLEYDLSLALPYYLNFDAQAALDVEFSVEMPMAVELSKNPSFSVSTPQVSVSRTLTGSAKAAMQIGAVVHLEKAFAALCAGPMCAGPWLDAKQDAYVGVDAWALANCASGYGELIPTWSDTFSYSKANQNKCAGSLAGAGGYVEIPKTSILYSQIQLATIPIGEAASASSSSSARLGASAEDEEDSDCSTSKRGTGLYNFAPMLKTVIGSGTYLSQDIFALCEGGGTCKREDVSPPTECPTCVCPIAPSEPPASLPPTTYQPPTSVPPTASQPPARSYAKKSAKRVKAYDSRCCDDGSTKCAIATAATAQQICGAKCDACADCKAFDFNANDGNCGFSTQSRFKSSSASTYYYHVSTSASLGSAGLNVIPALDFSPTVVFALAAAFVGIVVAVRSRPVKSSLLRDGRESSYGAVC